MQPYSKPEVVKALQQEVNAWLNAHPNRTKTSLARTSTASEASVRRLLNDGTLPNAENISKIVSVIRSTSTVRDLVSDTDDQISKMVSFHMPYLNFDMPKETVLWTSFAAKLNTQIKKMLFVKIGALKTVSAIAIKDEFGSLGLSEVKTMVSDGLLKISGDGFAIADGLESSFTTDTQAVKEIIDIGLKMYYKPEFTTNYSLFEAELVSKKGYGRVMDVLENAHKEIREIAAQHPGEVPLFVAGFMDTMTADSFFGEGRDND